MHRVTSESLKRFEQVSREALEKARADMEFGREGSLLEYQKTIDERMMLGVEQATVHLQSELGPLLGAVGVAARVREKNVDGAAEEIERRGH